MKAKVIILNVLMLIFGTTSFAQSAAVADISTHGISMTPAIAAKLGRIELIKTEKYKVLDQFDMDAALEGKGNFNNCYGKNCLIDMGKALGVDYIFSGSLDKLGPKIVITLKMINVNTETIQKTKTMEFDDQPDEIQRMIEIVLCEMLDLPVNEENKKRLSFKNEMITSSNVGKVSNNGPRFGVSFVALGEMNDMFTRSKRDGGLESLPVTSNLGYQFELEYVGTESFSALFEIIPNVAGLEQGHFIPTLNLLNGFRFGQAGWEFAFGPSFGARRVIDGKYTQVDGEDVFMTQNEYHNHHYNEWVTYQNTPEYQQYNGGWDKRLDTRGDLKFNTNWVMAFGRTFRSGALNIPVNLYYSGNKYGSIFGASVGFNIIKSKKQINQK